VFKRSLTTLVIKTPPYGNEAVNAMLLNEFLGEHRKVQELESELAQLTAHIDEQDSADTKRSVGPAFCRRHACR
jgi:hypothetical protein